MITVTLPASMRCDEIGCSDSQPVHLVLLASGGFGFKPPPLKNWQVGVSKSGAFLARCPEHKVQKSLIVPEKRVELAGEPS